MPNREDSARTLTPDVPPCQLGINSTAFTSSQQAASKLTDLSPGIQVTAVIADAIVDDQMPPVFVMDHLLVEGLET